VQTIRISLKPGAPPLRILHITPWFPDEHDSTNGIFIQRHIASLAPFCEQHVLHIQVPFEKKVRKSYAEPGIDHIYGEALFQNWRLIEWRFYQLLRKELKRLKAKETFSHVIFHIAYPALLHFERILPLLPENKILIEHWSVYHFNFNQNKPPRRLQQLFDPRIKTLAVSKALISDIEKFSGKELSIAVLPNAVDVSLFKPNNRLRKNHFLAVANWKAPKTPIDLLKAIAELKLEGQDVHLKIGGYGVLEKDIIAYIENHQLHSNVKWIGRLTPEQLADELCQTKALLHPTAYETFSVIIAEALCCGCPVLANNVGAVNELINSTNGLLMTDDWKAPLLLMQSKTFDNDKIAEQARSQFSMEEIGKKFFNYITK
jgi:glycosyltransferase involved in cell wall biosynthesis